MIKKCGTFLKIRNLNPLLSPHSLLSPFTKGGLRGISRGMRGIILFFFCFLLCGLNVKAAKAEEGERQIKNSLPGETISLDFKNIDIEDVLMVFSEKTGLNVVTDDTVKGKITLRLKEMPVEQALRLILESNNYNYTQVGKTLLVSTSEKMAHSEIVSLVYAKASEVKNLISNQVKNIVVDEARNSLILTDVMGNIEKAKRLIKEVDQPSAQVTLEARVMEVSSETLNKYGINWPGSVATELSAKFPQGGPVTVSVSDIISLSLVLNFLESKGLARMLANPKITTLNNQPASIFIGDQIPYTQRSYDSLGRESLQVNFVEAGVRLQITPQINEKGYITTKIKPEISSIYGWRGPYNEVPWIRTRQAEAIIRVKDGETIILGGLINTEEKESVARIPVLGWIPILGRLLFSYTYKEKVESEIVIMITPHILRL